MTDEYTVEVADGYEIRLKAAELAAQCVQGQVADGAIASRMMSLVVFFETYLAFGMDYTEEQMHLLAPRKIKGTKLKIIAGRKFLTDGQ